MVKNYIVKNREFTHKINNDIHHPHPPSTESLCEDIFDCIKYKIARNYFQWLLNAYCIQNVLPLDYHCCI